MNTFTNSAAEKAEGDAAAESALALTATTDEVEEIGTFVPVSKVQLEDVPMAEAYLTNRLTFMVRQKLDKQILEGSGTMTTGGTMPTPKPVSDPPKNSLPAHNPRRSMGLAAGLCSSAPFSRSSALQVSPSVAQS